MVELREENVKNREAFAPELNEQAVRLALEASKTAKMATQLAAAHVVNIVDEHVRDLVSSADIGTRCVSLNPDPAQPKSIHSLIINNISVRVLQWTRLWIDYLFDESWASSARTKPSTWWMCAQQRCALCVSLRMLVSCVAISLPLNTSSAGEL